jgi:hypothetical protein
VAGTVGDAASTATGTVTSAAQEAPALARRKAAGNPLAAGVVAFGLGWLVSSLLPATRAEQQGASKLKEAAQAVAEPVKQGLAQAATEVKDNLAPAALQAVEVVKQEASDATSTVKEQATQAGTQVTEQAGSSADSVAETAKSAARTARKRATGKPEGAPAARTTPPPPPAKVTAQPASKASPDAARKRTATRSVVPTKARAARTRPE